MIGEHLSHSIRPAFEGNKNDATLADIVVFSDCNQAVEAAIQHLEKLLDEDFVRKEFQEEVIRELSKSQVC